MRTITVGKIRKTVSELCVKANIDLRKDILYALKRVANLENKSGAKRILRILLDNAKIAKDEGLAICQDTGVVCVYLEIGQDVKISGGTLEKAVNDGVKIGYKKGYFRNSVVDALSRKNTNTNTPSIIYTKIVKGNKVKITVVPKGFGCENKSQLKMFKPTATFEEIKKFIIDVVKEAGADACPPFIIGVGIGGTFEKAAELSKEALLKKITNYQLPITNYICKLEQALLKEVNRLNIGPMGLGGRITALGVNILTHPTHIAGLPVAVSIGCHAMRVASKII
ncbi:MAG: fumarate hydratase [Candidatus Omnitrophica bacterium]|nr:fumarate hydratase [Candidatus Omnitrophota bacterium]